MLLITPYRMLKLFTQFQEENKNRYPFVQQ
jgi:hypothetical protein